MRNRFDEELDVLNTQMLEMGAMIEYAIETGVRAMDERDVALARTIVQYDREIDQKEREIESQCLKLLLRQQPVARDLRFISAALKMITDMERVGDQAADISEIVTFLAAAEAGEELAHIPAMAGKATEMVKRAVDAFVGRDLALAQAVIDMDDEVDELFDVVKRELIARIGRAPELGAQALDLLMIAKYLERIGDHAVNIAEWVEFAMTGIHN